MGYHLKLMSKFLSPNSVGKRVGPKPMDFQYYQLNPVVEVTRAQRKPVFRGTLYHPKDPKFTAMETIFWYFAFPYRQVSLSDR
jgi:hypothetical protein